ncbi:hypothetical protein BXZ70DRAFT_895999 [Cristinia sonorae]|uniref:Fe2OG dioxygenase domain-containing protein n=1 Tax=Cristinia sonorae TaxID=1940300 RepID=A0A8K0XNR6_9AGAR|nr:hypothetical protein BXZ70DRAFT_895999 [Cristinia sonorae]
MLATDVGNAESDYDSDVNSLFDEPLGSSSSLTRPDEQRPGRPIPGLYFTPTVLLPPDLMHLIMQKCIDTYFRDGDVNQVMLFERAGQDGENSIPLNSTLPAFLIDLLTTLSTTLEPHLPANVHSLLFPSASASKYARQVIINHYLPGEGISPHVDLLDRFADGIIGVSMGSGCTMRFRKETEWEVYLPSGSVYVMTEEARYEWTHEIEKHAEDWVLDEGGREGGKWIPRSVRVSVTFRWLLPGADVVGPGNA